jgi:predicted enzyme related to lactoylglutathione lyase
VGLTTLSTTITIITAYPSYFDRDRPNADDDHIRKSEQMGAKVVKSKNEIREGYYVVMEDPQGNTFGIWESK